MYIRKSSKFANARVLSLSGHLAILFRLFLPKIPPKWLKRIARLTARRRLNLRFVDLSFLFTLRDFFKWPTSKLAKVITVAFARISQSYVRCAFYYQNICIVATRPGGSLSFQHVGRHCVVPCDIVRDVRAPTVLLLYVILLRAQSTARYVQIC